VSLPGSPQADYEALVLSSSPSAYWTLGDVPGSTTALDQVSGTPSGTASGLVVFGVPGPVGWISTARKRRDKPAWSRGCKSLTSKD